MALRVLCPIPLKQPDGGDFTFNSLKSRLWLTNMIIIAVTVVLIVLFINIYAIYEFNVYKTNDLEKTYKDIHMIVSEQYINNEWDTWILEEVGVDILENRKILIALYDDNGKILYNSATTKSSNLARSVHMPYNHHSKQEIKTYNEKKYEMLNNGSKIGTLILSSTEQYDNNDLNYIKRITQVIVTIGLIAIILTIIISNLLSNNISKQISNITNIASDISKGNYGRTVDAKTNILELRNLILAINNLSGNLEHHEKLRKRLTQDIAHELRTPISTMQGNLEAVLDGIWEMDNEKVKIFYDEVQRLSRLVADLYNLSKYENSVLNKSLFDINELFQYVHNHFEAMFLEKKIQTEIDTESIKIYADKDKLKQVFMNLILNAVNFTPEFGCIRINANKNDSGKKVIISISDTGIGISEEDIPYIFERFYRADKSRNRKNGGAGIGLSVVKAVIEAHEGNIIINSELGKGTVFILELPLP